MGVGGLCKSSRDPPPTTASITPKSYACHSVSQHVSVWECFPLRGKGCATFRTYPESSAKVPTACLVRRGTGAHLLGPTKTAVHAVRWQWSTLTENRDLGIAQTCLHIPALSLNISDKWLLYSKPQFLVKWEWSLRWENNNYLMGLLQTLNEIVSLAKWQLLWGGKRLFTRGGWAGLSFLIQCSER